MNLKKAVPHAYAVVLLLVLAGAVSLAASAAQPAQEAPGASSNPGSPGSPGNSTQQTPMTPAQERRNRNACFQKAGISKDLMDQRRSVMQQTRSQIESICGNSSLSDADKKAQIRQAREDAHKQMDGDLTPEQQKAIESCENGGEHPHAGLGPRNPCAGGNPGNGNSPDSSARNNNSPAKSNPNSTSSDTYQ